MDTRKHEHEGYGVSIDMEKLADSLSGELESLHPLARECSIYRVPEATRCSHPSHFTPRMVSIGPFHHGKEELKAMEEHKKRYLKCFLQRTKPSQSRAVFALKDLNIPSVMELHQAGVKFKRGSSKDLLDIKFNEGILEIPFLTVYDPTERLYRNVLAFEMMHSYTKYLNDYIIMMNYLVSTSKDAELLLQNEIIGLGNTEAVPTVFRNLDKGCAISYSYFQYSGVVADLQAYCKLPWHKWKATLKQNYFNTPWASISVIAAVILLLLTSIQTVCSLIAL
ncbi:transmembrane protein [Citrus sinensis]|uniref:Transmembrane protein n=1 Tax=Citrus sinensis TaxID=2711 RepID=A0ACB8MU40_CITSI|nr:transmembrane protein [Citrus sinensis]KAH9789301.1 transmembrane protein [Citrus sinensis]